MMITPLRGQTKSEGPLLVLPDAKAHHLTLFDPQTRSTVAVIPVTGWPHEVDFSPDGRLAYAPSYSDAIVGAPGSDGQTIEVIDMEARAVTKTWDLGRPLRPHRVLVAADGTLLVSTELGHSISIVDPKTGSLRAEIPTGAKESHMFAVTADGRKIYTSNIGAGSVSVLDVPSRKLLKTIVVSAAVQRIWLSTDGRWAFVTDRQSNTIAVIDTRTDTIARRIAAGGTPFIAYPSPDGKWLLVGEDAGSRGKLEVVDLGDFTVKQSFDVDARPYGIRVIADRAFVTCILSGNLDVLNLKSWTLEPPIPNLSHGDGITIWPGLHARSGVPGASTGTR